MIAITSDVLLQRCLDACPDCQTGELERIYGIAEDRPLAGTGTWRKLDGRWYVSTTWETKTGEQVLVRRKNGVVSRVVVDAVEKKCERWLSRVHSYVNDPA